LSPHLHRALQHAGYALLFSAFFTYFFLQLTLQNRTGRSLLICIVVLAVIAAAS
jgi:hypothetical protein